MNCQTVKPLLSEFMDETLDASAAWQVQTHLSGCAECARISRELEASKRLLKALPSAAPSAGFDAALMQRLALTRRPAAPAQTWRTQLAAVFAAPRRPLRPALALGVAAAVAAGAVFFPVHPPVPAPALVAHSADPAFVADCVAQHHRDTAAEPLADLSAQTLAGNLDNPAAPDSSAGASGAGSAADSGSSDPSLL